MGVLVEFPLPDEPSPEERAILWEALEHHERKAEGIRRVLGLLAIEQEGAAYEQDN